MSASPTAFTIHEVVLDAQGHLRAEWVRLRHALWDDGLESLDAQLRQLAQAHVPYVGFLACTEGETAVAFAEASLRPYVNGCETSPVVFLEGLYVAPAFRRQGLARQLVSKVEAWGAAAGCAEFASDIRAENHDSHSMHLALGFKETERVIYFRKRVK
jgi:aminoglycoside 6'-N-acetyltransferase I